MKHEIPFILDGCGWPAFVVEESGVIRRVNAAAVTLFGPAAAEGARLTAIWSTENSATADSYLQKWIVSPVPTVQLKFNLKGGGQRTFTTLIGSFQQDTRRFVVFQLAVVELSTGPATGSAKAADEAQGVAGASNENVAAHKQKLDCALKLTRTVALDFNNALTSILGHTSHLLSQMEPNHAWRASLVEVEKSAERAAEIAHDLAAFSLQEKDTKTQVAGNLNTLLRRTTELFQNTTGKIMWPLQLEPRLYSVTFDEAKMQQAFTKVFENSIQSISGDGKISVRSRNLDFKEPFNEGSVRLAPGHYVCVEVTDTGAGITPDVLPRIFEPFFTTKPNHRGLGLAWVYGIVTNHGGSVEVVSEPGSGTVVRVFLPANKAALHEVDVHEKDFGGAETILMVDDEEILLTMGQMVLSSFGYRVLTCKSGKKALELMAENAGQIDLVITDLVMPNMSGRELIEHLKKLSPNVRILCMSGYVRSSKSGVEGLYLQKPFTSQGLLRKVKQALSTVV